MFDCKQNISNAQRIGKAKHTPIRLYSTTRVCVGALKTCSIDREIVMEADEAELFAQLGVSALAQEHLEQSVINNVGLYTIWQQPGLSCVVYT